jgi:hypothetical protein
MNFFLFTKKDYDYFVEQGMLDEEYAKLLEMEIKGYSRTKMAMELVVSESKLDTMIKNLKEKLKKLM